ncbi:MAG: hypothetical protein HUJ56_10170 [Erysipelotrichaceae bacterium]|nr:hypothetical protein [Erysipelotrichaceae bacterium]
MVGIIGISLVIVGGVIGFLAINKGKGTETKAKTVINSGPSTTAQMNAIHSKLKEYFSEHSALAVTEDFNLRLKAGNYVTFTSLLVYKGEQYLCSFNEFGTKYPDMYNQIVGELVEFSKSSDDKIVVKKVDSYVESVGMAGEVNSASELIQKIHELHEVIDDEEISQGLHETEELLQQISFMEEKLPGSTPKLEKLYSYYIPLLIDILNQYKDLQSTSDEAAKKRLKETVKLINEAMKMLIGDLRDEDFVNLKADMATLKSLLQQDGLATDDKITLKL